MGHVWNQSLLFSVLTLTFLILAHSSLQPQQLCDDRDRSALLLFKQMFTINCTMAGGSDSASAYPKVNTWGNVTDDCCYWDGVGCNQNTGSVIQLDLSGSCLYGTFPINSSLFDLPHLQNLNLASNHFNYSQIPPAFGKLYSLTYLNLSSSFFSGPIPSEFSKLSSLTTLDLSYNYRLHKLDDNHRLFGSVHAFLMLRNLTFLDLSGVNLISSPSIVSSTNLSSSVVRFTILGLNSCNLTKFPDFLRGQDELKILTLSLNKIQGNIPEWFVNISKDSLLVLDLSNNSLTGFERPLLELRWKLLEDFDMSNNMLKGLLPTPSNSMVVYKASNNIFTGAIPEKVCNAGSLRVLDLSGNRMSGQIPHCLGDQLGQSLQVLNLRGNNFNGSIPRTSNKSCSLKMINLGENQLQGNLSRSLANCKMLEVLDIGRNSINDTFPSWLGSLPEMQVLVLRYNNFHGVMAPPTKGFGFPKLRIIDLSCNSLSGDFPSGYLEQWKLMQASSKDNKHPSGKTVTVHIPIPGVPYVRDEEYNYVITITNKGNEMLYPKILNVFTVVDFSSNNFTGRIPDSIGSLTGLEALNLSNNNLDGHIPPSVAYLTNLESLDLSRNILSGVIPEGLSQVTSLEVFNVSHNKLVGPIPDGQQFNTFNDNSSFDWNPGLCGSPLSKKCGNAGEPEGLQPSSMVNDEDEDEEEDDSEFVDWMIRLLGCASGCVVGFILGKIYITDKYHDWFVDTFGKTKSKPRGRRAPRRRH